MTVEFKHYVASFLDKAEPKELEQIFQIFECKTFCRGERFKHPDTIVSHLGFLQEGAARRYLYNERGEDITVQIIDRPGLVSDIHSLNRKQPNSLIIECLEVSTMLLAPIERVDALLERNLAFNILLRRVMATTLVPMIDRQILFLTSNATERYAWLQREYPELLQRFPLRYLASLIGVTATQMSRIRRKLANGKS